MSTEQQLADRIRNAMYEVRRKNFPLVDLIPMMQEAADTLSQPSQPMPEAAPKGWKLLKDSTHDEREWKKDADHENGRYSNTCCNCGREFIGHKRRVVCRVCSASPAAPEGAKADHDDEETSAPSLSLNQYAEFWERLPGHLIDNHEGEELTEEMLQRAAADLYAKFPDLMASGLKPFGLLLLEERATTRQLTRALREATEAPTFMGEPVKEYGWLYDWTHSSALGKPDAHFTGFTKDEQHARKHENVRPVYTYHQPPEAAKPEQTSGELLTELAALFKDAMDLGRSYGQRVNLSSITVKDVSEGYAQKAAAILSADDKVGGEAVYWICVIDPAQKQQRIDGVHIVGCHELRRAKSWCDEQRDFYGWRYTIEPLYTRPQQAAQVPLKGGVVISGYRLGTGMNPIKIERVQQLQGSDLWAVRRGAECLNKDGSWEYEPMPSSRDEDFLARCRFNSAEDAIEAAHGITGKDQ